jgi:hypothetical protein
LFLGDIVALHRLQPEQQRIAHNYGIVLWGCCRGLARKGCVVPAKYFRHMERNKSRAPNMPRRCREKEMTAFDAPSF